jgi:hypothetical protein
MVCERLPFFFEGTDSIVVDFLEILKVDIFASEIFDLLFSLID